MTAHSQAEFDELYPEGSLIRQEKLRELENLVTPAPAAPEPEPEPVIVPEVPAEGNSGSNVPEDIWRAGV